MQITMPQLGESVVEGTISRWLKREGEQVERYEPLLEIITDKVNAEYPAPVSGRLSRILVPEGETVEVGVQIAEIATDDQVAVEPEIAIPEEMPTTEDLIETQPEFQQQVQSEKQAVEAEGREESGKRYSPVVRRLAQEHNIDLSLVRGTGSGGRVTRQDVERYIEQQARQAQHAPEPQPQPAQAPAPPPPAAQPAFVPPMAASATPTSEAAAGDELVPLTAMRRAIAEHMARSAYTAPHVTTVIEVDMTPIVRFREQVRDRFQEREGVPLTYLPFVIQAVVQSLKEHPILNSSWSEQGIVLKKQINIGIAVGMEDGLIVPVIRNADEKSLVGLARAVSDLATRARNQQLKPDDVQGGTFTVNNPGTFGTIMSTPIINQPQAGILSTEAVVKRPVVVDDAIAIRSMMYISLSIDHRILDGLQAARFLQSVKQRLEGFTPESAGI